jgi:hypothetical protein
MPIDGQLLDDGHDGHLRSLVTPKGLPTPGRCASGFTRNKLLRGAYRFGLDILKDEAVLAAGPLLHLVA